MKINYGINRGIAHSRRRLEHKNGMIEMRGDWNSRTFHGQIRQTIQLRHPGWSITGYAISPAELVRIDIWSEGYKTFHNECYCASYFGHCRATDLQDACDYMFAENPRDYNSKERTLHGRKLFDNEADARKAFG